MPICIHTLAVGCLTAPRYGPSTFLQQCFANFPDDDTTMPTTFRIVSPCAHSQHRHRMHPSLMIVLTNICAKINQQNIAKRQRRRGSPPWVDGGRWLGVLVPLPPPRAGKCQPAQKLAKQEMHTHTHTHTHTPFWVVQEDYTVQMQRDSGFSGVHRAASTVPGCQRAFRTAGLCRSRVKLSHDPSRPRHDPLTDGGIVLPAFSFPPFLFSFSSSFAGCWLVVCFQNLVRIGRPRVSPTHPKKKPTRKREICELCFFFVPLGCSLGTRCEKLSLQRRTKSTSKNNNNNKNRAKATKNENQNGKTREKSKHTCVRPQEGGRARGLVRGLVCSCAKIGKR